MRGVGILILGAAIAMVAACGSNVVGPAPSPTHPATPASASAPLSPPLASPSPSAPGASPSRPATGSETLTCGHGGVEFPATALSGQPALTGPDDAVRALRALLEAGGYPGMPAVGWRTVVTTETSLTFLAQGAATWWIVTVAADPAGGWQASEYGECHLAARLEKSLAYAEWRLDPKHPPKPGGRTVTLLATEQACASGRPPGSRLLAPLVEETDAAVTVTLLVRRRGNADCQANPEFPVIVSLGKALGTRSLLDGSSVPPARRG